MDESTTDALDQQGQALARDLLSAALTQMEMGNRVPLHYDVATTTEDDDEWFVGGACHYLRTVLLDLLARVREDTTTSRGDA